LVLILILFFDVEPVRKINIKSGGQECPPDTDQGARSIIVLSF